MLRAANRSGVRLGWRGLPLPASAYAPSSAFRCRARRHVGLAVLAAAIAVLSGSPASAGPPCPPQRPQEREAAQLAAAAAEQRRFDVDGAIAALVKATQLDPTNHRYFYRLAMLHKNRGNWPTVSTTLEKATQLAPREARYWHEWGLAQIALAERDKATASWELARDTLTHCLEVEPKYAACYHDRGTTELFLDQEQRALADYTKAILLRPTTGYFYPPLADLYLQLDYPEHAEKTLQQGLSLVPESDKNKFNLYLVMAAVRQQRNDTDGMIAMLEEASKLGGEDRPEILFNLGSAYVQKGRKRRANELLEKFFSRACRGTKMDKYREQCDQARTLMGQLARAL